MAIVITIDDIDVSSHVVNLSDVAIVLRNRSWSPVFQGLDIQLGYSVNDIYFPSPGDVIEILIDGTPHYLGYISHRLLNENNFTWQLKVKHYLMQLESYIIQESDLHNDLVEGTANFTSEVSFTVDTTDDYLNVSTHGKSNGDRIQLASTGTLPAGLSTNHNYYVGVRDANSFYLFTNKADYYSFVVSGVAARKVDITSAGTGTHTFSDTIDFNLYTDWGFYPDIPFSTDTTFISPQNDQILSQFGQDKPLGGKSYGNPVGNYYPQNFLVDGALHFTIVEFYGEDLPQPLQNQTPYVAAWFWHAGDDGFVLYTNMTNYVANSRIDLTDHGSGNRYFQVVSRFTILNRDNTEAETYDENSAYPTPFVALKWLIIKIFSKIGITLDTSEIDAIKFVTFESVDYTWDEIYLMEKMLYNLNQSNPVRPSDIVTPDQQLTYLQFVQDLFGKMGINLKYTGSNSYKLITQKRTASGDIDPENENEFAIPDDNKVGYKNDYIQDWAGWIHSRFLGGLNYHNAPRGFSHVYNDREKYHAYSTESFEYNNTRHKAGINNIDWINHLCLFLKNKGATPNFVLYPDADNDNEFYDDPLKGLLYNQKLLSTQNVTFDQDEIICRMSFLSQAKWNVKELFLDVKTRRIKIIQEQTLP